MDFETIKYTKDKRGVARLTLNRPEALNSQNAKMRSEIPAALRQADADPEVKILVVTGEGRAFCAGLDVKEASQRYGAKTVNPWPEPAGAGDINVRNVRKITIAAVNGPAVGMGCDLALCCDFRVMSEKGSLWEAYARLMPPSAGTWYLPRLVGLAKAMEILLLGEPVEAKEAERLGLVYKVVPHEKLENATEELIGKLLKYSPAVMQFTKRSIMDGLEKNLAQAMDYISYTRYICDNLGIIQEAAKAISQKRPPKYPA
jgi:2-(1,2-epoxy-1,2-dihydrophenyl)acetyl-CoA isomerase